MPIKWTENEVAELRRLWWDHTPKEIFAILVQFSPAAITRKASILRLQRSPETSQRLLEDKRRLVIQRNITVLGRERNYENAKKAASLYLSRTQFCREDPSMYRYVKDNNLWDDLCGHMAIGRTNYSEAFLYECVRHLFPNNKIMRNTRSIIKPYELDIYLPELKIAFEYDGIYWHSRKTVVERDKIKDILCSSVGILLYRVLENKSSGNNPELFIVNYLRLLGFDTSSINITNCKENAFKAVYSQDVITKIVAGCSSLLELKNNHSALYNLLYRRGLLEKYTSHLRKKPRKYSPEMISLALSACSTGIEFRTKHLGMYLCIQRRPTKFSKQVEEYRKLRTYIYDENNKRVG